MSTLRAMLSLGGAGLFLWAAVVKLARPERWTESVRGYRLPQPVKRAAVLAVPWFELLIVIFLMAGWTRLAGLSALVLLGAFSAAIVRLHRIVATKAVPCGCFGSDSSRDYRLLLLRNGVLAAGALALLLMPTPAGDEGWPLLSDARVAGWTLGVLTALAVVWTAWYALHVHRPDRV
jgi:hypothetical protein